MFIYGLKEKGTEEIRYVGKTIHLNKRLNEHLKSFKNKKKLTKKEKWIKSVLERGKQIEIMKLEEIFDKKWENREIYWVSKFDNLTNSTKGGSGGGVKKYDITYEECKNEIKKFNLKSKSQWLNFRDNLPNNIPRNPNRKSNNRYRFRITR